VTPAEHSEPKLPAPRSRWVSSLLFGVVIFACGTAAGIAVGVRWEERDDPGQKRTGEKQSYAERLTAHLTEDLELSSEQSETVYKILSRHTEEFRDIHATISPKLKTQMDCLRDEVGEILDDRQRTLWEEKVERLRRRTQSHF